MVDVEKIIELVVQFGIGDFEVPPVMVQKNRTCLVCGVKSTDLRVEKCGLHSCDKEVCKKDAHLISTWFGQFDG